MAIRAVFFDLGGTLFSYGSLRGRIGDALGAIARDHGLEGVAPEDIRHAYQASVMHAMAEYRARDYYLHRDIFADAHRRMLERLGVREVRGEGLLSGLAAGPEALGADAFEPREGTRDVLARLRGAGLHLSIVSNIDDDQFEAIWGRLGLSDLFDATTTSEEARSCKPHRAIYDLALGKAGVPAETVAFVGDSLAHDVAGANAVGMRSIWLSSTPPAADAEVTPHHVIADLRELPDLLLG